MWIRLLLFYALCKTAYADFTFRRTGDCKASTSYIPIFMYVYVQTYRKSTEISTNTMELKYTSEIRLIKLLTSQYTSWSTANLVC